MSGILKTIASSLSSDPASNVLLLPISVKSQWRQTVSESYEESEKCEFKVVNRTISPVLLCWIGSDGKFHHYRRVNDSSIRDSSVDNSHTEYTISGHAFIILKCMEDNVRLPESLSDARPEEVICLYKVMQGRRRHILHLHSNQSAYEVKVLSETIDNVESMQPLAECASKPYEESEICGFRICSEPGIFPGRSDVYACLIHDLQQVSEHSLSSLFNVM
jgi:hypothetical protein